MPLVIGRAIGAAAGNGCYQNRHCTLAQCYLNVLFGKNPFVGILSAAVFAAAVQRRPIQPGIGAAVGIIGFFIVVAKLDEQIIALTQLIAEGGVVAFCKEAAAAAAGKCQIPHGYIVEVAAQLHAPEIPCPRNGSLPAHRGLQGAA